MDTVDDYLKPLAYHLELRDYLKAQERELWHWFASAQAQADYTERLRLDLLKATYRLDPDGHPDLYAGFYELDTMILAMGIFYGGIAQIIAGVMEWKKNNTFGTTAFTSYGLFWLTLVGLLVLPKLGLGVAPTEHSKAAYLALWGVFTLAMFFGTLRLNRALQLVFASLALLFFLLAWGDYSQASAAFKHATGWEGVLCGGLAIYTAMAQVLNEVYGRTLLPLGLMSK